MRMAAALWVVVAALIVTAVPTYGLDTTTPSQSAGTGTKDAATFTIAIIGAVTGVLGAVLGVVNTWNTLSQRRLRVEVTPAFLIASNAVSSGPLFSIGVTNLSNFAISAEEVGFSMNRGKHRTPIMAPRAVDGKSWPRQVGPRESVSLYFDPSPYVRHAEYITGAYVRLASGEIITGTSPALKQLLKFMSALARGEEQD